MVSAESLPSKEEVKDEVVAATKATASSARSFVAGGVGGVCAVIVGHPFDLVKVRMQTAERGVYTGAIDVVRKTVAREGFARVGCKLGELCCTDNSRTSAGSVCWSFGPIGRRDAHV